MNGRRLALPALAVLGLLALALLPFPGGGAGGEVPTVSVARADFVHRVSADGNLRAVKATHLGVPSEVGGPVRIAWMVPDGSHVDRGDPIVRFDPTDMEKQLSDARDDLATTAHKVDKERSTADAEVANLGRDADLAALELDKARRFKKKDELLYSRNEIIESEIDENLAQAKQEHSQKAQTTRRELATTELELLGIEKRQARLKIDQASKGLAALAVRAPHSGIVVFQRDWRGNMPRVGDTVYPGLTLAEIPDLSRMEAEVYVLEADAGGLAVDKPARLRLEAHPELEIAASISHVDSLAKPRVRGSPVQYFAVTLELARTDPRIMKPGQRVHAELLLDELHGVLTIPLQAVFEKEGKSVVYRRQGSGFVPVEVELGPRAGGRTVVEKGLSEGDVIALRDPDRPLAGPREPPAAAPALPRPGGGAR